MTKRALMALMMIAKFETGRIDKSKWRLNVSPVMLASLRKQGMIDDHNALTLAGWGVEGENAYPEDGAWFVAHAD